MRIKKLSESLKPNLKTYFSIFIFSFFFFVLFKKKWTNLSARQIDFPELKFLEGNDNQSWICVGFIRLVSWPMLRVWKQMWIAKTQKRCDGILEQRYLNNVASKIYLTLLCSLFLWCFFFILMDFYPFFYWWTVYQTKIANMMSTLVVMVTLVQGNLKEIFFYLLL